MRFSAILLDVIVLFLFCVNIKSKVKNKGNEGFELRDCMKCCKCCKQDIVDNQYSELIKGEKVEVVEIIGPDGKHIIDEVKKKELMKDFREALAAKQNGLSELSNKIENGAATSVKKVFPDIKKSDDGDRTIYDYNGYKIIIAERVIPKEQYYEVGKTISNFNERVLKVKACRCEEEATKQSVDMLTLGKKINDGINKLKESHNKITVDESHKEITQVNFKDTGELEYLYAKYITRGNNVRIIKDVIFDFRREGFDFNKEASTCWQVKQLSGSSSFEGVRLKPVEGKFGEYLLTFTKKTTKVGATFEHKVASNILFLTDQDDCFEVIVESDALGVKGSPSVYTRIFYCCIYDPKIDTTFLFIILTFHYAMSKINSSLDSFSKDPLAAFGNFFRSASTNIFDSFNGFADQVKAEGKDTVECLVGSTFSNVIKNKIDEKKKFSKLDDLPKVDYHSKKDEL